MHQNETNWNYNLLKKKSSYLEQSWLKIVYDFCETNKTISIFEKNVWYDDVFSNHISSLLYNYRNYIVASFY